MSLKLLGFRYKIYKMGWDLQIEGLFMLLLVESNVSGLRPSEEATVGDAEGGRRGSQGENIEQTEQVISAL